MIRPVKRGSELLREIEHTAAARPVLWWLGQSGFAIKYRDIILYIDPYLSESLTEKYRLTDRPHIRMTEAPLRGHEIAHADLLLATHGHSDHLDPGTAPAILEASPEAKLVLPRALLVKAQAIGIRPERMLPVDDGEHIDFHKGEDACRILAISSAHEELAPTPEGCYPCLGYVLCFGDVAVYHPGDCVLYDGLVKRLAPLGVTVALLPINGRDPKRGVPGNFSIEEAAWLAGEIGVRWIVPMHYDMFTFNTVDVRLFEEYLRSNHAEQDYRVLACGERWSPWDG